MTNHAKIIAAQAQLQGSFNGGMQSIVSDLAATFRQIETYERILASFKVAAPTRPTLRCTGTDADTLDELLADCDSLEAHAEVLKRAAVSANLAKSATAPAPAIPSAVSVATPSPSPTPPAPSAVSVVPATANWTEKAQAAKGSKAIAQPARPLTWTEKAQAAKSAQ
jgi:hypothetical protein